MIFHFLGHAGFFVRTGEHELLIDPFLSGNSSAVDRADDFSPTYILLTHGHADHYGDTEAIAERSGGTVVSSFEIAEYLSSKGLSAHGMNPGGSFQFPFGKLKFTPAWHSNSLPDGTYGGMPMGLVLEAEGKRVYHAGDTALFSDMQLIARGGIDLALLPIGDNYTMGPDDAVEAVRFLNPKRVVPIHYDTFPVIEQDVNAFKRKVERETDASVTVLKPGERLEL
jgi:L-ascorbate metabolism protein UlaG (beta-lactamase superfamily)